jgi:hypothetical protein
MSGALCDADDAGYDATRRSGCDKSHIDPNRESPHGSPLPAAVRPIISHYEKHFEGLIKYFCVHSKSTEHAAYTCLRKLSPRHETR